MKYTDLGKTGYKVSVIGYGGVVSSQHFDKAFIPGDGQNMSDHPGATRSILPARLQREKEQKQKPR